MNDNRFSMAAVFRLRAEASAAIGKKSVEINELAAASGDVDFAMQLSIAERSIDDQQALLTAARRLAALLETGVAE